MEIKVVKSTGKKSGKPYVALSINGIYVTFDTMTICRVCDLPPSVLDAMAVGDVLPVFSKDVTRI